MSLRFLVRDATTRAVPGYMADRARRHQRAVRERQGLPELTRRLTDPDGRIVVRHGPMAGLQLAEGRLAEIDAPVAKVLGTYEQELASVFYAAQERDSVFVDVGCADGYFAVGMTVRSPKLVTHAYDISRSARDLCRQTAAVNACRHRVTVHGRFDARALRGLDGQAPFLLCDIEGAEAALFDRALVGLLAGAHVLIEVHEFAVPGAGAHLRGVFSGTHDARAFEQAPRRQAAIPELERWDPEEARRALDESRPRELSWLLFSPR